MHGTITAAMARYNRTRTLAYLWLSRHRLRRRGEGRTKRPSMRNPRNRVNRRSKSLALIRRGARRARQLPWGRTKNRSRMAWIVPLSRRWRQVTYMRQNPKQTWIKIKTLMAPRPKASTLLHTLTGKTRENRSLVAMVTCPHLMSLYRSLEYG